MITHTADEHNQHSSANPWLKPLAIGAVAVTALITIAPYALPLIGVGNPDLGLESSTIMHGPGNGTGLAGGINNMLASIPVIGSSLAKGGIFTAIASGAIGIGGVLLGNHMQKGEDGKSKFSLGKLIKYASLATSALIALPSILTGISVGLVYLCASLGDHKMASDAVKMLYNSVGAIGISSVAGASSAGIAAALPHVVTCGAAIIPAAMSLNIDNDHSQHTTPATKPHSEPPAPLPEHNTNYTDGSILAKVEVDAPLAAGKPCRALLRLTHKTSGQPVTPEELAVNFTEKMHLFVVDQSLKDYHHIHPTPTSNPGEYSFTFTPKTPNAYNAWTDITLLRDDRNHRLKSSLPCALERNVRAYVSSNTQTSVDGMNFQWKTTAPLRKNSPSIVEVTITDNAGMPITDLQPVMGAFAHMVGFSADAKSIIHTHPLGADPQGPTSQGGPKLRFHVDPDFTGATQFYIQVRRDGKDTYAAFGQQVAPPALNTQKFVRPPAGHGHHATI